MALKGKIYSIARQHDDLNTNELFESMIDKSAAQDTIVMDGRNIAAGSIFAEQIHANAITSDKIKAGEIQTDHMLAGTIDVDRLKASQLILPGKNYGGVVINNNGISMKSTGTAKLDIKLSSDSGFNITDGSNNQLIDIDPSTGNVIMQVNQLTIGNYSAATTKDIDDIEVGGRNLLLNSRYIEFAQGTEVEYKGKIATKLKSSTSTNHGRRVLEASEDLIKGETYTYSVLVAFEGEKPDNIQLYLPPLSSYTNADGFEDIEEGKYGRIHITRKATRDGGLSNPHLHIRGGDGHVYFTKWKIEKGNKATDWTPAPEDVEVAYTAVAEAKANLAETEAKAYADDVVDDEENRAIKDAEDKLEEAIKHANSQAGDAETNAKKHADDKAETAETNAKDYAKKQVDDIEVGGRNLFIRSTSEPIYITDNGNIASQIYGIRTSDYIEIDGEYITTVYPTNTNDYFLIYSFYDDNKNFITRLDVRGPSAKKHHLKHENIPNNAVTMRLWARHIQNGKIKLEKGNKATDWTPAPEDVQVEIDSRPTFEDFDKTDKVTINGGNIKAGTISSEKNYSWIDLDNGRFNFGNGSLVWNGSSLDVKGNLRVSDLGGTIPKSKLDETVQDELGAGTSAKSTLDSKERDWDTGSSRAADALSRTTIHDRRNDNRPPSWYLSNYPKQVVQEFKLVSVIGVGQGVESYGILTTTIQYPDSSGGRIKQEFKVGKNIYTRSGSGESWDSWTDPIGRTEAWSYNGTTEIDGKSIKTGTLEANKITTGTLSAQNGNSWLNLNNGEFNFASGGLVYSGGNLTLNGKLSVTNLDGKLSDSQITSATKWDAVTSKADKSEVVEGDLYLKGTGYNRSAPGIVELNGKTIYSGSGRGHRVIVINRSTLSVVSSTLYDTHANAQSTTMANALKALNDNVIVAIVTSDSAYVNNVLIDGLRYIGVDPVSIQVQRVPQAYLGIPGYPAGSAIQSITDNGSTAPYAEISTKIINGIPQGINTDILPVKNSADTANSNASTALDRVTIKDTRTTNESPSWYYQNYPSQTVTETKEPGVMGFTGTTPGTLTTVVPSSNTSDGAIKQTFRTGSESWRRSGTTSWTSWSNYDRDGRQAKVGLDEVEGKINNAVTTIDGTGVTVKDGSFFLVDDTTDTKYAVPTKENLIKNHSFEEVNKDSKTGKLHMQGSEWEFIQEDPYELLPGAGFIIEGSEAIQVDGATHAPLNFFGNYSMMVNNKNYLKTELAIRDNGTYTISAYFRRPPYAGSGGQPRFKLYEYDVRGGSRDIGTFTFDRVDTYRDIKRYSTTFDARAYVPAETSMYSRAVTFLEIMSASSDFVQVDGVQLVEGDTPVVYDAEVNHWDFINGGSSVKQLNTRNVLIGGLDGKLSFGNYRIGTSEIYTGDASEADTGLNIRGNSGINLLGERVDVKTDLYAHNDIFANVNKKVVTIVRSAVSIAPNAWVTINLPSRGLYILGVGLGANPGAYVVGNWNTGLVWSHLGGNTATIERISGTELRIRMSAYYQYGLVRLN